MSIANDRLPNIASLTDKEFDIEYNFHDVVTTEAIDLPIEKQKILLALALLRRLDDDWNGQGAIKPSKITLDNAVSFIQHLPIHTRVPVSVTPADEGDVVFNWADANKELLIVIEPMTLHLAIGHKNSASEYVTATYDGTWVPPSILTKLPLRA